MLPCCLLLVLHSVLPGWLMAQKHQASLAQR
jgi:hypothetical protein